MDKYNKIGLVVAMSEEQQCLYSSFGSKVKEEWFGNIKVTEFDFKNSKIYMADSGVGEISATMSTQLLILKYGVQVIFNFGVVGSLSGKLKCKDIAFVGEVVHYDFTTSYSDKERFGKYLFQPDSFLFYANKDMLEVAKNVVGDYPVVRIASGDKFIDDSNLKNWLTSHFGCDICDMESAGIYFACKNHNVPFLMIKAASDNADEDANEDFASVVKYGVNFYVDAVKKLLENIAE